MALLIARCSMVSIHSIVLKRKLCCWGQIYVGLYSLWAPFVTINALFSVVLYSDFAGIGLKNIC
jgi:hypothetical protein